MQKATPLASDYTVNAACAEELRALVDTLAQADSAVPTFTLGDLGALGTNHGWRKLAQHLARCLEEPIAPAVATALQNNLHNTLCEITRPCFELQTQSAELAEAAIRNGSGLARPNAPLKNPARELLKLFREFPVLAKLWAHVIATWRECSTELFARLAQDRESLAREMFQSRATGKLLGLTLGLSDRHNRGRTVAALRFTNGRVIYKPRSGDGEWEWQRILALLNRSSVVPKLYEARVLRRPGYCWMEYVQRSPCRNLAAVRRFYLRAGALAAAAELTGAVDCHRGNLIAAGEHPVLIDADALLHPNATDQEGGPGDAWRTQFFAGPKPARQNWHTASLHPTHRGTHAPRLAGRYIKAINFEDEILSGFVDGWQALTAAASRAALRRILNDVTRHRRRRIYRATRRYYAMRKASLAPSLMRSGDARLNFLHSWCSSPLIRPTVSHHESEQLRDLDIPFFTHRGAAELSDRLSIATPLDELLAAIRQGLRQPRRGARARAVR